LKADVCNLERFIEGKKCVARMFSATQAKVLNKSMVYTLIRFRKTKQQPRAYILNRIKLEGLKCISYKMQHCVSCVFNVIVDKKQETKVFRFH